MNNSEKSIFRLLYQQAKERFPGKKLKPLSKKTWEDCFVYQKGAKLYQLHYDVEGDNSSHCQNFYC
jgi:hypothetical protein